jgi:excisionase family DNA binding protein
MSIEEFIHSSDAVISRSDAAILLKCDPRTVGRGIEDGSIPSIKLGRRKLIPLKPFLKLLGLEGRN